MSTIALIVPCYNEASRLQVEKFISFSANRPGLHFFFVNDGSQDETEAMLHHIQSHSTNTRIISLPRNKGKGEAVRQGILMALQEQFDYIGYMDADLSTSLDEMQDLMVMALEKNTDLLLGSRIKKIDTEIERSFIRHLIGRTLATVIDGKFKFGIYDTQCGAKIFRPAIVKHAAQDPFFTRWFFDVELLYRIKQQYKDLNALEIPLKQWRNVKNSRIGFLSFPTVLKELFILLNKY